MLLELQKGWPGTPFMTPSWNASALMQVLTQVKILREYIKTQSHQPMPQGSKTQVVISLIGKECLDILSPTPPICMSHPVCYARSET